METFLFFKVSFFVFLEKFYCFTNKLDKFTYLCENTTILGLHTFFNLTTIIEPKKNTYIFFIASNFFNIFRFTQILAKCLKKLF